MFTSKYNWFFLYEPYKDLDPGVYSKNQVVERNIPLNKTLPYVSKNNYKENVVKDIFSLLYRGFYVNPKDYKGLFPSRVIYGMERVLGKRFKSFSYINIVNYGEHMVAGALLDLDGTSYFSKIDFTNFREKYVLPIILYRNMVRKLKNSGISFHSYSPILYCGFEFPYNNIEFYTDLEMRILLPCKQSTNVPDHFKHRASGFTLILNNEVLPINYVRV